MRSPRLPRLAPYLDLVQKYTFPWGRHLRFAPWQTEPTIGSLRDCPREARLRPWRQEDPLLPEEHSVLYRPRQPREPPLYRLVDSFYDKVKGRWEQEFERRYGFCRGSVEDAVYAFLDCGIFDRGFAR